MLLILSSLNPCLDFEDLPEDHNGIYQDDEVYYEEPDLSGAVEGVDYLIAYGADGEDEEES